MRILVLLCAVIAFLVHPASAEVGSWSTVVRNDPFNGTRSTFTSFEYTDASLSIECSKTGRSLVTIISPFEMWASASGKTAGISLAVNDEVILSASGTAGEYSNGHAGSEHPISTDAAVKFLRALVAARGDIAVKSDIFDRIVYFPSVGSTAAAKEALAVCSVD